MSTYNDTAMLVTCPACKAPTGEMCWYAMARCGRDFGHQLEDCHPERYALAQQTVGAAVEKAVEETA